MSMATDTGQILGQLTAAQKVSLTSGSGTWHTRGIPEAGIPSLMVCDGPHGLRKVSDQTDVTDFGATPATCFPPAAGLGSSWNPELVQRVGRAVGREAAAEGVSVVLGPGVNIKRSPLGGRNFEYISEDPLLAGRMGAAFVRGVQSWGVGACPKHFAANNQETDRMRVSVEVDERTLREIYLPAFEHIVTTEDPATVMAAYNRINGVHAAQNPWLLTEVLRAEWGFQGLVISDWGAVTDRSAALAAGLDLEMPPATGRDADVERDLAAGALSEAVLDTAVGRVLALVDRTAPARTGLVGADHDEHHALARLAALESAVLLKNEGGLLPLSPDAPGTLAVIGEFARSPRFQGGGSSHVTPTRVDSALDAIRAAVASTTSAASASGDADGGPVGDHRRATGPERVVFAPGFTLDGVPEPDLFAEAVRLAGRAETVLVFLGLPESAESEGRDRDRFELPADQLALLDAVAEANDRVVVVLSNGSGVAMEPWQRKVAAVFEGWLLGQAGGSAIARLLFGAENPSGKLAESIPLRLRDNPSHLHFPGGEGHVRYGEGLYVGYRYYDTLDAEVAYPFGHGLSYSTFEYRTLRVRRTGRCSYEASFTLTNTGSRAGAETAQLYVRDLESTLDRPAHELKAFAKVRLEPGASATVTLALPERAFAYWSPRERGWTVEAGEFELQVGASSRDIRLRQRVSCDGSRPRPAPTGGSTVGEWIAHPAGPLLRAAIAAAGHDGLLGPEGAEIPPMIAATPVSRLVSFLPGMTAELIEEIVGQARAFAGGQR